MEICFIITSYLFLVCLIMASYMRHGWIWWRILDTGNCLLLAHLNICYDTTIKVNSRGAFKYYLSLHLKLSAKPSPIGGSVKVWKWSLLQGVPQYWAHFVFCHFLRFWSTYRGTSDLYSTALEICFMIATRILKIDLEIA